MIAVKRPILLLLTLVCLGTSAAAAKGIDWIEGDYDKAMKLAKRQKKPLFIDLWAPWCHTCISMKRHIFTDEALKPYAKKYVWLALDTDKPESAAALDEYPVEAWPTLYVISPVDGSIQGRHVGAATPAQVVELLEQGLEGHKAVRKGKASFAEKPYLMHWREADTLMAEGKAEEAAMRYKKAYDMSPRRWSRRQALAVSWARALRDGGRYEGCLKQGGSHLVAATSSVSSLGADFVQIIEGCIDRLDPAVAQREDKAIRRFRKQAARVLEQLIKDGEATLTVDDRADAMRIRREVLVKLGLETQARKQAEAQLELLDKVAYGADDPAVQEMYSWPRSEVYMFLGRGADLVDHLRFIAEKRPESYDAQFRYAWMLHAIERDGEAQRVAKKAVGMAYGPRKARLFTLLADIHHSLKDYSEERRARMGAVAVLAGLPKGQKDPEALAAAEAALKAVPEVSTP